MRNTQPSILSEIVRLSKINSRLSCRSGVVFCKYAQFSFRHSKFRGATIQTDHKLCKYPHDRLVNVFQSGEMDAHLRAELPLVVKSFIVWPRLFGRVVGPREK